MQILHIARGTAQAWLDGRSQTLVGPCVLLLPALVPHGFVFAPDIDGTVVTVLEQHLARLLAGTPALAEAGHPVWALDLPAYGYSAREPFPGTAGEALGPWLAARHPGPWCLLGHSMGGAFGYAHLTGGYAGGQAEYVRVPMADVGPMVIPEDIQDDDAVLMTDALPTGYQAAEMGDIQEGDTVVVAGVCHHGL